MLKVAGEKYEYEVLDSEGRIDLEFRRKYVGAKFKIKYDPAHLKDFVALYREDEQGRLSLIANAQPKRDHEVVPVLMEEGDRPAWEADHAVRDMELARDMADLERVRRRTGITPERLIEEQELLIKLGGKLPKADRNKLESGVVYASPIDRM